MGFDKLMLDHHGVPILQHAVNLLTSLPVYERILITSEIRAAKILLSPGIRLLINSHPEKGVNRSIQIGVEAATGTHYLFLTADQPKLETADILQLLEAADENPDRIIHPLIKSKPNSPTLFPGSFRDDLLDLYSATSTGSNDFGGRMIRNANRHMCITIEPEYPHNFEDIDNADDYKNLI